MSNRIKPSVFDVDVSFFYDTKDTSPKTRRCLTIVDDIENCENSETIEYLRSLEDADYKEEKKIRLHAFTPSGTFYPTRKAENLENHTGLYVLDFDDVPNLSEVILSLQQDPYTLVLFVSPSGKGLKLIVRVRGLKTSEQHKAMFPVFERYYRQFGITPDPQCKDVSRLCFVSSDANLYRNEEAVMFSVEEEANTISPKKPTQAPISDSTTKTAINTSHTRKIALKALEKAKEAIRSAPKGTRHETRLKHIETVGGYVQINGLKESEVRAELLPIVRDSSDSPEIAEREFEEFLMYGIERPIDLEKEAQKQREYAARKGGK
jgi:hypothetical protein